MFKEQVRGWWGRLVNALPWRRPRLPVWGEGSPKVLGVCRRCGAMVMEGWHAEAEDGCLCQRCAHALADKKVNS